MTWRDRNGPVFRKSPDSAWPLTRDSGRLPEGEDPERSVGAECEASQSGPKGIAKTTPNLLYFKGRNNV